MAIWVIAGFWAARAAALPSVALPDPQRVASQGGAAILEIPIPAPPGLGGFQPDLRLRYSSQGGDGPFGVGWSLGLSEVRRTTRFGPPTFDDTTLYEYELDGQLLVPELGSGATAGRFHTLSEGFQRILLEAGGWSVTSPNGVTARYGTTDSSRVVDAAGRTVRWHVSEMEDAQGNRICFSYLKENNVAYLDSVSYTHRGDCSSASQHEIRFVYDETRPDDTVGYFAGGFWELTKRVSDVEVYAAGALRRHLVFTYASNGTYSTDRSRLEKVTLQSCFPTGSCEPSLPETLYTWADSGTTLRWNSDGVDLPAPVEEPKGTSGARDLGWRVGDLDADGIPELVQSYETQDGQSVQGVYRRTATGYVLDSGWTASLSQTFVASAVALHFSSSNLISVTATQAQRRMYFAEEKDPLEPWIDLGDTVAYRAPVHARLVDMNGDRRADLVASYSPGQVRCSGDNCPYDAPNVRQVWLNNGQGWTPQPAIAVADLPAFETLFIKESDNGFGQLPGDASCLRGSCTVKGTMLPSGSNLADVDGDGRLDVLQSVCNECKPGSAQIAEGVFLQTDSGFVWDAGFSQLLVSGQGGVTIKHLRIPKYNEALDINFVDQGVRYVDVNGDGLADLVKGQVKGANGASLGGDIWELEKVYLSTGTGWDAAGGSRYKLPTALLEWDPNATGLRSNQVVFADLNGDGLVDVTRTRSGMTQSWLQDPHCVRAADSSCVANTVWRQDGHFDPPMSTDATVEKNYIERSRTKGVLMADFDGDAGIDFLKHWGGGGGGAIQHAYSIGTGYFSDRIEIVANGEGGQLTLTYASLVSQRDDEPNGLEAAALLQAGQVGEAPVFPLTGGRDRFNPPLPVVTEATFETAGQPAKRFGFAYAGSMWSPLLRISWGPRLRRTYAPDADITRYVHQNHGIGGRLSRLDVDLIDETGAYTGSGRRVEQEWNSLAFSGSQATANGTWPGSVVGRLAAETARNRYPGQSDGAVQETLYTYGKYNFVTSVVSRRPSGDSSIVRTPFHLDGDPGDSGAPWILGLPETEAVYQGLGQSATDLVRETTYTYYASNVSGGAAGKLQSRTRSATPALEGNVSAVSEQWTYDAYGNPATYTDPLLRVTSYCYDGGSLPTFDDCPAGPGLTGVQLPTTTSGGVSATEGIAYTRDPMSGEIVDATRKHEQDGAISLVDRLTQTLRADGRIQSIAFAAPVDSAPETLETRSYTDEPGATITRVLYADDQNAIATLVQLDGFGRVALEVGPGARGASAGILREYDHADRVTRESYPAACPTAGCSIAWADVRESDRKYDGLGRILEEDSFGEKHSYAYSRGDRNAPTTNPAVVPSATAGFDVVTYRDPRGNETRYWRDGDRVAWVDECSNCSDPSSTFYAYEVTGEVRGIFNPALQGSFGAATNRTAFAYNSLGWVVEASDPDSPEGNGERLFTYDAGGNLRSATNVRDQTVRYEYDEWGRLTKIDRSLLPTGQQGDTTVTYDDGAGGFVSHGRAAVSDPAYSYSYAYDKFGRLARETLVTQGKTLRTDFAHDRLGRPTVVDYPISGARLLYQYDDAHLIRVCGALPSDPTSCNAASWWLTNAIYDGVGRPQDLSTPAGHLIYGYDAEYRLTSTQFTGGTSQVVLGYTYDDAGNLVTRTDGSVSNDVSLYAHYGYDGRNRVKTFQPASASGPDRSYTFDVLGNLTQRPRFDGQLQQQHFDVEGAPYRLAGVTPPGASRLNFTYDADGNRTYDPLAGRYYAWNADGRLTKVGTSPGGGDVATHGYDLDGRRIFSKFNGGTEIHVYAGDLLDYNTTASSWSIMYVYAFDQLLGTRQQKNGLRADDGAPALPELPMPPPGLVVLLCCTGTAWLLVVSGSGARLRRRPVAGSLSLALVAALVTLPAHGTPDPSTQPVVRFYVTDLVGSAVVSFDSAGNQKARRLFDPYGTVVAEWTPEGTAQWFGGRPRDAASGLFDLHARWYDAATGGFLSVDPLVGQPGDPQRHNAYAYARGNPVTLSDPTGLCTSSVDWDCAALANPAFFERPDGPVGPAIPIGSGAGYGVPIGFSPGNYFGDPGPGGLHTVGDLSPDPFGGLASGFGAGARFDVGPLNLDFSGLGGSQGEWQGDLPGYNALLDAISGSPPNDDGVLTLAEANYHYRHGNGQPLTVDLGGIDFSNLSESDFGGVGSARYLSPAYPDRLVYGNIRLTLGPGGAVTSRFDVYDFDIQSFQGSWLSSSGLAQNARTFGRNALTVFGSALAGSGIPYRINFTGVGRLGDQP